MEMIQMIAKQEVERLLMIEFIVNYNMMNVRTETFQQTIDKNRINNFNFQQEFEQYEKDLIQWKKDNGEA